MNSVIATTKSAIYLAVKHIFPEVPINAGTFEPLKIVEPEGTFLYAHYPRPVSGCAAEVSQRIAEAVFAALTKAIPDLLFAAPAGTSGNLGVGGYDPERKRSYIMYLFTGGGYGGFQGGDGLSNGCSTIGISKMPPVEVLEQFYPVLFEEFSLREGSGGAGEFRGGFGINYAIKLRRGEARVSMVMDHGRSGPQGVLGGGDGGTNTVEVSQGGKTYRPPHLSKDQDIEIGVGDVVRVSTPGGGGFGDPARRKSEAIARDVARGYYSEADGSQTNLFNINQGQDQTVSPGISGATRFFPGDGAFGVYVNWPKYGHSSFSQDSKNTWNAGQLANGRVVRFYPLKQPDGSVVANAYVVGFEAISQYSDQQDVLYVIRNVRLGHDTTAPAAPPYSAGTSSIHSPIAWVFSCSGLSK